jgi:hypothetical protein
MVRTAEDGSYELFVPPVGVRFPRSFDERALFLLTDARVVQLSPDVHVPIRGRAVDRNGDPVPDARVRIRRNLYGRELQFPWGLERTASPLPGRPRRADAAPLARAA